MIGDKADAWTASWQIPVEGCFDAKTDAQLEPEALEFWRSHFDGAAESVVDLACGNGVLAWLVSDLLRKHDRSFVTGVDLADIAPFEVLGRDPGQYPSIRFVGNTPLERLPFPGDSFDAAVSQYGIEYSDLQHSIPEMARVLKPSARIAFILHDRSSALVQGVSRALDDIRDILDHLEAPALILEVARLCAADGTDGMTARNRKRYHRLVQRLENTSQVFLSLYQRNPDIQPVLVYKNKLNTAFREATKADADRIFDVAGFIDDARESLHQNILRLEHLEEVAPDDAARARLLGLLKEQGFSISGLEPLLHSSGALWGTKLSARRDS